MSTQEIEAVKRVIEECVSNGYDDFPDDPHTFGHLTSMRAVLARLEGMAAPGGTDARISATLRSASHARDMWDSPSPQQPTQEPPFLPDTNVDFLRSARGRQIVRDNIDAAHGDPFIPLEEAPGKVISFLDLLETLDAFDRFAAQRVTAAPTSQPQEAREVYNKALIEGTKGWSKFMAEQAIASIIPQIERALVSGIDDALTATTDKARREAIETCEDAIEEYFAIIWRPEAGEVVSADSIMEWVRERFVPIPQHPGDAAPQQESTEWATFIPTP